MNAAGGQVWLNNFITKNHLDTPELRRSTPLYTLDVSEEEFRVLRETVREDIRSFLQRGSRWALGTDFWFRFVLFGALCYAKNFDGGIWSWDCLYEELDIPGFECRLLPSFQPKFREAAHFWGYEITEDLTGKKYFGSLLILAGMPSKLVHSSGALGKQFDWVTRLLVKHPDISKEDLVQAAVEQLDLVIRSLDTKHLGAILVEAASCVRGICDAVKAIAGKEGVTDSDITSQFSYFKAGFPCAIVSKNDYLKLMRETLTSMAKGEAEKPILRVERFMTKPDGNFRLVTQVRPGNTEPSFTAFKLQFSPEIRGNDCVKANLFVGNALFARVNYDNKSVSITPTQKKPLIFRNENALRQICYRLETQFDKVSSKPLPGGEPLDLGEPQVFAEEEQGYEHLGSGSVRTIRRKVLFTVPAEAEIECDDTELPPVPAGTLLGLQVLETQSAAPVVVRTADDEFIITPAAAKSGAIFELRGDLAPIETAEGYPVFKGEPEVSCIKHDSLERLTNPIVWRNSRGHIVKRPDPDQADLYSINVRTADGRRTLKRFKAVIIPKDAAVFYQSGALTKESPGGILLLHWGALTVTPLDSSGIYVRVLSDEKQILLDCSKSDQLIKPEAGDHAPVIQVRLQVLPYTEAFTLNLAVPYAAVMFFLDGRPLKRESIISSGQAEKLVIYAACPIRPGMKAVEYAVDFMPNLIGARDVTDDQLRWAAQDRITVPLALSSVTGTGLLTYDDFKDALVKVMRRSLHRDPENPNAHVGLISISVDDNRRKHRLEVNYRGAEIGITTGEDDQLKVQVVNSVSIRTDLVFRELFPKADENGNCLTPAPAVHGAMLLTASANVPSVCRGSNSPWIVAVDGDTHYRIRPAMTGLDYREELHDGKAVYPFLSLRSMWEGNFTADDWPQLKALLDQEFQSPASPQWRALEYQCAALGTRGFAELPYWRALRQNVAYGFVFALIMDILIRYSFPVRRPGDPSILYAVSRRQNWRWDLMSVGALSEALQIVSDFCSRDEGLKARLDFNRLLGDDVFENVKFARKFKAAVCLAQPPFVDKLVLQSYAAEMLRDDDPYAVVADKPSDVLLGWLRNREYVMKHKQQAKFILLSEPEARPLSDSGARLRKWLTHQSVFKKPMAYLCRYLNPLLDTLVGSAPEDQYRRDAAAAAVYSVFVWSLAYGRNLDDYNREIMRPLINPAMMFAVDRALADESEWTLYAALYGEALAYDYLKKQS